MVESQDSHYQLQLQECGTVLVSVQNICLSSRAEDVLVQMKL